MGDNAKLRLLYLPGTVGGLLVVMEALYWATGLDPFISVILGAVPAYFFGVWFTENVFAQKPLVAQAVCPECQFQFNLFFGDLFGVQTDASCRRRGRRAIRYYASARARAARSTSRRTAT